MDKIPYLKLLMMFNLHNDSILKQNKEIKNEIEKTNHKKENNKRDFKLKTDTNGYPVDMQLF